MAIFWPLQAPASQRGHTRFDRLSSEVLRRFAVVAAPLLLPAPVDECLLVLATCVSIAAANAPGISGPRGQTPARPPAVSVLSCMICAGLLSERSSVPRSVAMSIVGHKTEPISRRYAIVDEVMQREAAARLDASVGAVSPSMGTVAALEKGKELKRGTAR